MNARQRSSESSDATPRQATAPLGRWALATTLILILGGGVSFAVWQQVRDHVLASGEYQIDPQKIVVTPPPPWIRSDIKTDVIREASFDGPISLLDAELTVRMAAAFAAHPWVAHVERVSKHFPSSLEVVLEYRKPVAMVEVKGGALPIDIESVVLPSGDFTEQDVDLYPRVSEIHTTPSGPVGTRWGDAAVNGAARVAAALAVDWQPLGLFRIVPAGRKPGRAGVEYEYALYTQNGTRVDWGRAPSPEILNEMPAADKIARLREFASTHGSLNAAGGPQRLRFCAGGQLESLRRSPVKPLPPTEQ